MRATAEAEARHFWFRGFRAFVVPLIDRPLQAARHGSSIAAAGPAPTWRCSPLRTGLRLRSVSGRTANRPRGRPHPPGPGNRDRGPVSQQRFDLVTSFDVLYSLEEPDERRRSPKCSGCHARRLRPDQRGGDERAARRPLGAEPRGPALQPRAPRSSSSAPASRSCASPTRISVCSCRWRWSPGAAVARACARRQAQPPRDLGAVGADQRALTGLLLLESVWLRRFNSPFGSSLVCLARKPV